LSHGLKTETVYSRLYVWGNKSMYVEKLTFKHCF